ncbi:hypothetical protein [Massilia timonae]|uniref:hypothetical protein n=1 Tax=Massilia timonae TaxID=47229 RepID=UPI00289D6F83|nr:hypothetical protein [Massilia timonae]
MTLCINYVTKSGIAIAASDSLITTTKYKQPTASFLPTNEEILHQTPYAVKVHNITGVKAYTCDNIDILVTIAGNVLLGLQCALHIESYLKHGYNLWPRDIELAIESKIHDFWRDARDRSIKMSFSFFDHKRNPVLLECRATGPGDFNFGRVESQGDFILSVLGDGDDTAKASILSKANAYTYTHSVDEAIHIASLSALQHAIDDPTKIFIGGHVQASRLQHFNSQYLVADYEGDKYFRGTMLDDYDRLDLPILDMTDKAYSIR